MNLKSARHPPQAATSPTRGEVSPYTCSTICCYKTVRKELLMKDTSPLVGEVARRAGEGSLVFIFLLLFFLPLSALAESSLEKRASALYQEVRCPVCLGQSIADSETDESQALKIFILEKLKQGESEDVIRETLRLRFGDEILLRPPFEGHTLFLWLAPFGLFFLLVLGVGWRVLRFR